MTFDPTRHPRDARGRWIMVEGLPQGAKITDRAVNEALQRGMLKMSAKPANELEKGAFMLTIAPVVPPGIETAPRYVARDNDDRLVYYDPKLAHIETINPEDPIIARNMPQPNEGLQTEITPLADKDIIYRGISAEEWESIQRTGQVLSTGEYNIGDAQKGLTYWTTDVDTAAYYANSFMPWQFKPTFEAPAFVIATRMPAEVRNVPGTGEHEVGVARPIRKDELVGVWRGDVYAFNPGSMQLRPSQYVGKDDEFRTGGGTAPSADIVWTRLDMPGPEPEPEPETAPQLKGEVPLVIRDRGQTTVSTTIDTFARPGHLYVGMDAEEYVTKLKGGLGIIEPHDAWNLPSKAEDLINGGLTDPRISASRLSYLVEVEIGNASGMRRTGANRSEISNIGMDRISRVLVMSADDAGRIVGHLIFDKDNPPEPKPQTSAEQNRTRVQGIVGPLAEKLGFDPNKVMATNEDYQFTLNGRQRHAAGTADLTTGTIKIYVNNYGNDDFLPQLVAHEVEHQKFQAFLADQRVEYDAMMKEIHEWTTTNPNASRLDDPMKPDGTLREPWASKYPIYQAWTQLHNDAYRGGDRGGARIIDRMHEEDGCTAYSREYWQALKDGTANTDQAFHETLAEMAALRARAMDPKDIEATKDQIVGHKAEVERIQGELKKLDEMREEDKPYAGSIRFYRAQLERWKDWPDSIKGKDRQRAQEQIDDYQKRQADDLAARRKEQAIGLKWNTEMAAYLESQLKVRGPKALLKSGKPGKRESELWNRLYTMVNANWDNRHRYKKP